MDNDPLYLTTQECALIMRLLDDDVTDEDAASALYDKLVGIGLNRDPNISGDATIENGGAYDDEEENE